MVRDPIPRWSSHPFEPVQLLLGGLVFGFFAGAWLRRFGKLTQAEATPPAAAEGASARQSDPRDVKDKSPSKEATEGAVSKTLEKDEGTAAQCSVNVPEDGFDEPYEGETDRRGSVVSVVGPLMFRTKSGRTKRPQPQGSKLRLRQRRKSRVQAVAALTDFKQFRNAVESGETIGLADVEKLERIVFSSLPLQAHKQLSITMAHEASQFLDKRGSKYILATYDQDVIPDDPSVYSGSGSVTDAEGSPRKRVGDNSGESSPNHADRSEESWDSGAFNSISLSHFRLSPETIARIADESKQIAERIAAARETLFEACEIPLVIQEEASQVVASMSDWNRFDIFKLKELVARPLPYIVQYALAAFGLDTALAVQRTELQKVLLSWDSGYKDVAFHSSLHGADVTSAVYFCLTGGQLRHFVSQTSTIAMLIGAAVHDIGHPGVGNAVLVAMGDPLAVRYNDQSILENFHAATAFQVLKATGVNLFGALGEGEKAVRKSIISIILGTDMALHNKGVGELKTAVKLTAVLDCWSPETEATIIKSCVHGVDISNPVRPWHVYQQWVPKVMEEFFCQADLERKHGLKIEGGMAFLDRNKPTNVPKFQYGFAKVIVLPMYEILCEVKGCCFDDMKATLVSNIERLKEDGDARAAELEAVAN